MYFNSIEALVRATQPSEYVARPNSQGIAFLSVNITRHQVCSSLKQAEVPVGNLCLEKKFARRMGPRCLPYAESGSQTSPHARN